MRTALIVATLAATSHAATIPPVPQTTDGPFRLSGFPRLVLSDFDRPIVRVDVVPSMSLEDQERRALIASIDLNTVTTSMISRIPSDGSPGGFTEQWDVTAQPRPPGIGRELFVEAMRSEFLDPFGNGPFPNGWAEIEVSFVADGVQRTMYRTVLVAIPEPSAWLLLFVAVAGLALRFVIRTHGTPR